MIIDCPAGYESAIEDVLEQEGDPAVSAVILTHWDKDHYGGVLALLQSTGAKQFFYNHDTVLAWPVDGTLRRAALNALMEPEFANIDLRAAARGVVGTLGVGVDWRLLAPYQRHVTEALTKNDRNLASGIIEVVIGQVRLILGGDADGRVWQQLLDDNHSLKCEVLKWPHHGALNPRGGLNEVDLMAATNPQYVVFSVGSHNRYGHPQAQAIAAARSARLACTEVTPRCHSALQGSSTACGGTLTFWISDGTLQEQGGWRVLDQRVQGWAHPLCRTTEEVSRLDALPDPAT
jgi:competence protein ComEC